MFDLAIRGGRVVTPDATTVADVGIRDGAIEQIGVAIPAAKTEIDASGLLVLSGLIDVHVHFNQPGREDWEGALSGKLCVEMIALQCDIECAETEPVFTDMFSEQVAFEINLPKLGRKLGRA